MARLKLKKKKKDVYFLTSNYKTLRDKTKVPMQNLPANFLWMRVRSGTKIRNVLKYSLKEFRSHNCVVWSAIGQGIAKVISCIEIFKKKLSGLHQMTKLRYIKSNKQCEERNDNMEMNGLVPEIHILLTRNPLDTTELSYQAPGICSTFQNPKVPSSTEKKDSQSIIKTRMSSITAEEFAAMGLRTGQKRPWRDNRIAMPTKRTKKRGNSEHE